MSKVDLNGSGDPILIQAKAMARCPTDLFQKLMTNIHRIDRLGRFICKSTALIDRKWSFIVQTYWIAMWNARFSLAYDCSYGDVNDGFLSTISHAAWNEDENWHSEERTDKVDLFVSNSLLFTFDARCRRLPVSISRCTKCLIRFWIVDFEVASIMLRAPLTIFCSAPSVVVNIFSSWSLASPSDLFSSHQEISRGTLLSSLGQSDCSSSASLLVKHGSWSLSLKFKLLLLLRWVLKRRAYRLIRTRSRQSGHVQISFIDRSHIVLVQAAVSDTIIVMDCTWSLAFASISRMVYGNGKRRRRGRCGWIIFKIVQLDIAIAAAITAPTTYRSCCWSIAQMVDPDARTTSDFDRRRCRRWGDDCQWSDRLLEWSTTSA